MKNYAGVPPSIFATQPIDTVSNRYSFLPTSSILKGMRENGWFPFERNNKAFAPKQGGVSRTSDPLCARRALGLLGKEPSPA